MAVRLSEHPFPLPFLLLYPQSYAALTGYGRGKFLLLNFTMKLFFQISEATIPCYTSETTSMPYDVLEKSSVKTREGCEIHCDEKLKVNLHFIS